MISSNDRRDLIRSLSACGDETVVPSFGIYRLGLKNDLLYVKTPYIISSHILN